MRLLHTFIFVAAATLTAAAQTESTDTVKSHELQEVVVEGAQQRASVKMTTYTAPKQAKEAAIDANDLLQRMAIPELRIDPVSKAVSTASGQSVTLFINYVQAEAQDITGLRTTDVKSVQYLDYPEDPRFKGVPHAVNFIVQEYEYGGYTKLTHSEFAGSGYTNQGSVFSKFAYKKMVYDLYAGWDYVTSNDVGSSSLATYRLPSATIERNQIWESSDFSYIDVPVTFRASYNTDKVQIINTVGYSFNDRMSVTGRSRLTFSDEPGRDFSATNSQPSGVADYGGFTRNVGGVCAV